MESMQFEQIYSSQILPDLIELEKRRKKHFIKSFLHLFIFIVIAVSAMIIFNNSRTKKKTKDTFYSVFGAVSAISLSGIFFYMSARKKKIVNDYKRTVIPLIVSTINDKFQYEPEVFISRDYFINSGLFFFDPLIYNGDDYFIGQLDEVSVEFSEIHAKYKISDKNHKPLFDGLFLRADFNKNANGKVFVLPDKTEKVFGKIAQSFQQKNYKNCELVKLENQEFEKIFKVYATDQVIGRYVLSSILMERIVNFQKKSPSPISLSVIDSTLFVAIPYQRLLFEPSIMQSLLNKEIIFSFMSDLQFFFSLVEELDLNTRIWNV